MERGEIGPDTLIRLSDALDIAFPLGGMTVNGLRLERDRRTLEIIRVAGRDFTTLNAIKDMAERCRVRSNGHASSSDPHASKTGKFSPKPSGSSSSEESITPQDALRKKLQRMELQRLKLRS